MGLPGQAEQPGECQSHHAVRFVVHGAIERRGDFSGAGVGHFFHTHHQHRITHAAGHHQASVSQSDAARGAGTLHFGTRNALQAELFGHQASQHFFAV